MKKIIDREKNMDNYIDNIYIVSSSNKNDICYKIIYLNQNEFELQILKKKNIYYSPRFAFFQVLDKIILKPNKETYIENTIEIGHLQDKDVKLIIKHTILQNIYNLEWNIEDSLIKFKIKSKNNDIISNPIELLVLSNEKNDIIINNIVNYSYSLVVKTNFDIKKKKKIIDNNKQLIPKIIIQTYRYSIVKDEIYNSSISWLLCNPEYRYEFYDDKRCIEFITKYFEEDVLNAFNNLTPGAYKADLFRYCYLYICGGIYTDIDNICMCNLRNVILEDDIFVSVKDRPNGAIYNAFIASTPKNPIFKNAIDNIIYNVRYKIYPKNITLNYNDRYLAITGPICLGKSLNKYLNRKLNDNFEEGEHNINNMKFKLFYLHHGGSVVTYNNKIIFNIKYDGYQTTSNYLNIFDKKLVYKT